MLVIIENDMKLHDIQSIPIPILTVRTVGVDQNLLILNTANY